MSKLAQAVQAQVRELRKPGTIGRRVNKTDEQVQADQPLQIDVAAADVAAESTTTITDGGQQMAKKATKTKTKTATPKAANLKPKGKGIGLDRAGAIALVKKALKALPLSGLTDDERVELDRLNARIAARE